MDHTHMIHNCTIEDTCIQNSAVVKILEFFQGLYKLLMQWITVSRTEEMNTILNFCKCF